MILAPRPRGAAATTCLVMEREVEMEEGAARGGAEAEETMRGQVSELGILRSGTEHIAPHHWPCIHACVL